MLGLDMSEPRQDIRSKNNFEYKIQIKPIWNNTKQHNNYWTVNLQNSIQLILRQNVGTCLSLLWQAEQSAHDKHEIVRQAHSRSMQRMYSRCTVINERRRVWLDITKWRRPLDWSNERSNERKKITNETNESKQIKQRIDYEHESNTNLEMKHQQQQHLLSSCFAFMGQCIYAELMQRLAYNHDCYANVPPAKKQDGFSRLQFLLREKRY